MYGMVDFFDTFDLASPTKPAVSSTEAEQPVAPSTSDPALPEEDPMYRWAGLTSEQTLPDQTDRELPEENPMYGMAGVVNNLTRPDPEAASWRDVRRRRDGAEGWGATAAKPRRHPLDELAEAGQVQEERESQSGDGDSLSDISVNEEHSDDDDVFQMKAASPYQLTAAYRNFWLYRWQLAEEELVTHLREEVLLPLDANDATASSVFTNVEEAVVLPPWHCPFRTCCAAETDLHACDKHEKRLWRHLWQETPSKTSHASLLRDMISKYQGWLSS